MPKRSASGRLASPSGLEFSQRERASRCAPDGGAESSDSSTPESCASSDGFAAPARRAVRLPTWWTLLHNFCEEMNIDRRAVFERATSRLRPGQTPMLRPLLREVCRELRMASLRPLLNAFCDDFSVDLASLVDAAEMMVAGTMDERLRRKRRYEEDSVDIAQSLAAALQGQLAGASGATRSPTQRRRRRLRP